MREQVRSIPSLPDRFATTLAPHLQASLAGSETAVLRTPLLTPAAAAVSASPATKSAGASSDARRTGGADGGVTVSVNCLTTVSKEGLLEAMRAVGVVGGIKAAPAKKSRGAPRGGHKETQLGKGLLAAIEVRDS